MVLVHPGHLDGVQAVGLAPQPSADQRRTRGADDEGERRGSVEHRQLTAHRSGHLRKGDPDVDDADDPSPGPGDGDRRADRGAGEGGGRDLVREGPAGRRRMQGEVGAGADELRVGVGVADAPGAGHHDVADTGLAPEPRRVGLEDRGGVAGLQRPPDAGGGREGLRDGEGAPPGPALMAAAGLKDQRGPCGEHQQRHDHQHQGAHLPGDAAQAQGRTHLHRLFLTYGHTAHLAAALTARGIDPLRSDADAGPTGHMLTMCPGHAAPPCLSGRVPCDDSTVRGGVTARPWMVNDDRRRSRRCCRPGPRRLLAHGRCRTCWRRLERWPPRPCEPSSGPGHGNAVPGAPGSATAEGADRR